VPARRAEGFFDQYARTRAREGLYAEPDYRRKLVRRSGARRVEARSSIRRATVNVAFLHLK